jgi:hypothetical protein
MRHATSLKVIGLAVAGAAVAWGAVAVPASADPATLTVGNPAACPGSQYTTIQAAVNAASSGDTISVCKGTYGEHVDISTPDLTLLGAQAGVDARGKRSKTNESIVTNADGVFTIEPSANDTTINGFVIQGARNNNAVGIADFAGSSGLTLIDNLLQLNSEGINMQNPDGSQPALISQNSFVNNNAGGNAGDNAETGTGVFISNGPANNTQIVDNNFRQDSQTAINFAGDSSRPSTGLVVSDNKSTDDSTFVVATNSNGAVIDHNTMTTTDANVPGPYGHGTGILDFGANTNLRITNNVMKATGDVEQASGISVSNYAGPSTGTNVVGNTISGWYNDIKVVTGNTSAYVNTNHVANAQNDGIIVQSGVSGVVLSHNTSKGAALYSCEDDSADQNTGATPNTWLKNTGDKPSNPPAICKQTGGNV